MKIAYLDLFYRINRDVHQVLKVSHKKEIPAIDVIDDLSAFEIYEIMRQPVISLTFQNERPVRKKADLRLKILCCSCSPNCLFIYLFSGEKWHHYLKFY
jgi:hypothetical protein